MTTASRWVRLRTVLGWPVGIALVSWRYMWRTTPLHRSEQAGSAEDLPGPMHHHDGHGRQGLDAGVGPMLHRTYAVRIVNSALGPAALIDMVADKLDRATPEMAVFRKTRGADGPLRYGDEFLVRMPGPWDGPVRVVHRDSTSFRLATLDGHLEAGEIEFRASPAGDALRFEIESWARAGDRLADHALQQAQAGQRDPAQHVVPLLRPHGGPRGGPAPGRSHHPHPVGRLAITGQSRLAGERSDSCPACGGGKPDGGARARLAVASVGRWGAAAGSLGAPQPGPAETAAGHGGRREGALRQLGSSGPGHRTWPRQVCLTLIPTRGAWAARFA